MERKKFRIIENDFGEAIITGDVFSVQDFVNTMNFEEGNYRVFEIQNDKPEREVNVF